MKKIHIVVLSIALIFVIALYRQISDFDNSNSNYLRSYDFSKLDTDRFEDKGRGVEGFSASVSPKVYSIEQASEVYHPETLGIVHTTETSSRFYPYSVLTWTPVINDTHDGKNILVTMCLSCSTGIIYNRDITSSSTNETSTLEFGDSGYEFQGAIALYNRSSSSEEFLWSILDGKKIELSEGDTSDHAKELSQEQFNIVTFSEFQQSGTKNLSILSNKLRSDMPYYDIDSSLDLKAWYDLSYNQDSQEFDLDQAIEDLNTTVINFYINDKLYTIESDPGEYQLQVDGKQETVEIITENNIKYVVNSAGEIITNFKSSKFHSQLL